MPNGISLGSYLKDRRSKLDPVALGFPMSRRRTPGLRREEVAARANVSATWYTWLEQGRGGSPSADVLDRIAHALMLTEAEREHLFLIALGRPPAQTTPIAEGITPRLQKVLDSFEFSPAMVRNRMWDVLAWNRAATLIMAPYGDVSPQQRNVVRMMFTNPEMRTIQLDWQAVARHVLAGFRADVARAGLDVTDFVNEMCRLSPEFETMWAENNVASGGEGSKQFRHPSMGLLSFEYSGFDVDGRPDLTMTVYTPATAQDKARILKHLAVQG